MMIGTFGGVSFIWIAAIIAVAVNSKSPSDSAANGFVAMIFLFNAVYAFGITPLQALFPVEVLSFEMRGKGMAFSNLSLTTAMLINQFAYPIALEKIKWKLYIVFVVWCPIQAAVCWWIMYVFSNGLRLNYMLTVVSVLRPRTVRLRSSTTSSTAPIRVTLHSSRRRSQLITTATFLRSKKSRSPCLLMTQCWMTRTAQLPALRKLPARSICMVTTTTVTSLYRIEHNQFLIFDRFSSLGDFMQIEVTTCDKHVH